MSCIFCDAEKGGQLEEEVVVGVDGPRSLFDEVARFWFALTIEINSDDLVGVVGYEVGDVVVPVLRIPDLIADHANSVLHRIAIPMCVAKRPDDKMRVARAVERRLRDIRFAPGDQRRAPNPQLNFNSVRILVPRGRGVNNRWSVVRHDDDELPLVVGDCKRFMQPCYLPEVLGDVKFGGHVADVAKVVQGRDCPIAGCFGKIRPKGASKDPHVAARHVKVRAIQESKPIAAKETFESLKEGDAFDKRRPVAFMIPEHKEHSLKLVAARANEPFQVLVAVVESRSDVAEKREIRSVAMRHAKAVAILEAVAAKFQVDVAQQLELKKVWLGPVRPHLSRMAHQ